MDNNTTSRLLAAAKLAERCFEAREWAGSLQTDKEREARAALIAAIGEMEAAANGQA